MQSILYIKKALLSTAKCDSIDCLQLEIEVEKWKQAEKKKADRIRLYIFLIPIDFLQYFLSQSIVSVIRRGLFGHRAEVKLTETLSRDSFVILEELLEAFRVVKAAFNGNVLYHFVRTE